MKTIKLLMISLMSVFFIAGCETKTLEGVDDDTEQSFTIINSSSSTFRIVDAQAGVVGDFFNAVVIDGDGIHKGGSQSFTVDSNDCDDNWRVDVYYNDPSRTHCSTTQFISCGSSTSFTFNNTTCEAD